MKWAKFNCGTGRDAYADKILALPSDYWAQIDIFIPTSTLTACDDGELGDLTAFVLSILDASTNHLERDAIYGYTPDSGTTWQWLSDDDSVAHLPLTPGVTQTLKVHWDGTHATWYVDGTLLVADAVSPAPVGGIRIGGFFSEGCECEWYFVTNVKIGTSDGASDIFAEDFSGGDFSAFTSTSGSCAVVSAPASCVAPPLGLSPSRGCFGDTITVTGSGFAPSSPLTASLGGFLPVVLSPATSDGSGDVSSTFEIPPDPACDVCTATLYITDDEGNSGQVTLHLCCDRTGDTIDATGALLDPAVNGEILDYIHHDGNHYVLVRGGPTFSESTTFPPDPTIHAATVYVIPDDGSSISSFDIDTDICWTFAQGGFIDFNPPTWFETSFRFDSWGYPIDDARFASDGTNLWLAVLTANTDIYPYISANDGDGVHDSQAVQFVDLATRTSGYTDFTGSYPIWERSDTGTLGGHHANPPYSDAGDKWSGYWTTPRLRMYSLSTGAASDIGYFDALYYPGEVTTDHAQPGAANTYKQSKLLTGVSIAASPAEVGVCHVVWAEGGARGRYGDTGPYGDGTESWDEGPPVVGWRVNYSKWDPGGVVTDADLWNSSLDRTGWYFPYDVGQGSPYYYGYTFPTTAEFAGAYASVFQVVNDGGSPVLFIAPATSVNSNPGAVDAHGNPCLDNAPDFADAATFAVYDLSTGAAVLMQTFDTSLLPTADETPISGHPAGPVTSVDYNWAEGFNPLLALAVSFPYDDPLLSGQPVYLVNVPWTGNGAPKVAGFYRIPVDLSSGFNFLDGLRAVGYSILVNSFDPGNAGGYRRFWSDAKGVWVPQAYHLDRECLPYWNTLFVTIPSYGTARAFFAPFYWDGGDYVYSMQFVGGFDTYKVSGVHICRGCSPCLCAGEGMFAWVYA